MASIRDVETWFLKALDIPEDQQEAYITTHLQSQPDLMAEVLELIRNNDDHLLTRLKNQLTQEDQELDIPSIERYALEDEIGRGGMAVVYRGSRTDGVFDHEVAVKVLKPGMNSEDFVHRFTLERNVLARLKHENIAQIIDGGITSDSRPYFVMELVEGEDIVSYANKENLSLTDRIHLFLKACEAIQFAHQNLIIHRDIKPSNILVNNRGQVKLMDFGIAQLMDLELEEKTPVFTPGYASPEQLQQSKVDVRTDVYQLGKVLKRLLKDLKVSRDMKLLMLHAIRGDAALRYQTVGDFINDIKNFLRHRPLIARERSWTYVTAKFIQRNKAGFFSTLFILLALVTSTTIYISRIQRANERILFEKNLAQSSVNLFLRIFAEAYPSYSQGDTLTMFELLDLGDSLLEESRSDLLSGRFAQLMGEIYMGYNRSEEAKPYYQKAIQYLKRDSSLYGDRRNMLFAAQAQLVNIYINLAQIDSAYHYLVESEKHLKLHETEDEYRPYQYGRLAWLEVNRGNYQVADSLYQVAVDLLSVTDDYRAMANQMAWYGRFLNYYDLPGRKEQIDSLYEAANRLFIREGLDTTQRTDYARLVNYRGLLNLDLRQLDAAEVYFKQAYEINHKIFGLNNLSTLDNLNNIGQILKRQEKHEEARAKFLLCWQVAQKLKLPKNSALVYYHNYATTLNELGRYEEAAAKFDSLVKQRERYVSHDVVRLNNARFGLAKSWQALGQHDRAIKLFELTKKAHLDEFGEKGNMDIRATIEIIRCYRKIARDADAVELFELNHEKILDRLGADSELIALNHEAAGMEVQNRE